MEIKMKKKYEYYLAKMQENGGFLNEVPIKFRDFAMCEMANNNTSTSDTYDNISNKVLLRIIQNFPYDIRKIRCKQWTQEIYDYIKEESKKNEEMFEKEIENFEYYNKYHCYLEKNSNENEEKRNNIRLEKINEIIKKYKVDYEYAENIINKTTVYCLPILQIFEKFSLMELNNSKFTSDYTEETYCDLEYLKVDEDLLKIEYLEKDDFLENEKTFRKMNFYEIQDVIKFIKIVKNNEIRKKKNK